MHSRVGQTPAEKLLGLPDSVAMCLRCHSGAGDPIEPAILSPDGSSMTPGGDFYWLSKTFTWSTGTSPGDAHGHNVVSASLGMYADSAHVMAPGGTFPSAQLTCTSCHDPHGKVGSPNPVAISGSYGEAPPMGAVRGRYRMLGGTGYNAGNPSLGVSFPNPAPVAKQDTLNRFGESDASHVAYGSGMSEWCANCHPDVLNAQHELSGSSFRHPSGPGAGLGDTANNYNQYLRTGDLSGARSTAYWALVPFETGVTDASLLDPRSLLGPDAQARIMCLTCHRAHGSAFKFALRWDITTQLVADSHPATTDLGVIGNDVRNSYYGRDMTLLYGAGQRILCEKCHAVPRSGYPTF